MASEKHGLVNELYAHVPPPDRRLSGPGQRGAPGPPDPDTSRSTLLEGRVRVIVTETNRDTGQWLRDALAQHPLVDIVGYARDGLEAAQMAAQFRPMICVVQSELPGMTGYQTCELISLTAPQVATIVIQDDSLPLDLRSAMRVGARACLRSGTDEAELLETIYVIAAMEEGRNSREFALATDPAKMPTAMAVSAAKGGVGKTTVAVNVGVTLAQRCPDETVLVDFYGQYGDAALVLNLSPRRNIVDLATEADNLDEELIETHLARHETGLRVLAGCAEPDLSHEGITPDFAANLLSLLRKRYRFIIFDLPPQLTPATLHIISRCQHFLVIVNFFELTTLRDTIALLKNVAGTYIDKQRIKVIGNRVLPKNEYMMDELEEAASQPIAHQIPDGGDIVLAAVNTGEPFVISAPRTPVSASIRALAEMLAPAPLPEPAAERTQSVPNAGLWGKATALLAARR